VTETYIRVQVGKHLCDIFPIQNGLKKRDTISPLLLNFALDYAFKGVRVNQSGLKVNVKRQLLVYADDGNILGGIVRTIKKNTHAVVVASKETEVEVNADKIKYMVMSRNQIARKITM